MQSQSFKNIFTEATDGWKQFNWYIHLIIGIVGVVVIGSVTYGFYRGAQVYQKHFPLIDASMEMRLEATTAYLWFEEMLGGDKSKSMDDILKHLDQALWYATAMVEGGTSGHLTLRQDRDTPFKDIIQTLGEQLQLQRRLIEKRTATASGSGPGTEIDQAYHETLDAFVNNANALEMMVKRVMLQDFQMFKYICMAVIAFSVLLFSIAGFTFHRYERLRRKSHANFIQMQRLMVQSEKMASLGMMISGMAHEVNNPNNFISFNIPMLKEYLKELLPIIDDHAEKNAGFEICKMPYNDFRADLHNLLKNIENGSLRINRIVSDLKDFTRKREKIKKEWFNVWQVIDRSTAICGPKIDSLVDSFETSAPDGRLDVFCDPEIVELIVVNFLMNAAEASDKHNSRVKLEVSMLEHRHGSLLIEVSDNGCGIEQSDMGRIFDPFFSTKSAKEGTGMGLYLCRSLAERMGAQIEVNSHTGKGSTFRLIIPDEKSQD